jgi:hypothetical protein
MTRHSLALVINTPKLRTKGKDRGQEEIVLDIIVERKTVQDLASSIIDGTNACLGYWRAHV